jgi:hypothetical protein
MKPIAEFELVDHGIENASYFQGCGLSWTDYQGIATGCGSDPAEAIDDALDQLAQQDWETEDMVGRIMKQEWPNRKEVPHKPAVKEEEEDCYYYISIRVK